ncbi:MAG: hypothetical protein IT378_17925, partial [Sandaracinaceae bacterium]|nr:hypothetical protein [Sandaracinaceae bacterium]
MTAKLAVVFSFAVALIACSSRTQVMVTVDAEPQVRAAARTLRVEVFGGTRGASSVPSLNAQIYPYAVTPDGTGWPRLIALAPQDGDTTRLYRVEARAYASSSENAPVIARAQVISGYVAGKVVWIRLVLQDACIGATCDPIAGETCVDGQCVAARRDEDDLPDYAADASYPDAGASGMDGGMPDGCRTRDDCLPSDCADVSCVRGQCIYSPRDERCADGADCTLDLCARAGSTMRCVHSPMPTFCDDGVGCTEDFCAPSEPGAQSTGCVFVPNAGLCTEGDNPRCDP